MGGGGATGAAAAGAGAGAGGAGGGATGVGAAAGTGAGGAATAGAVAGGGACIGAGGGGGAAARGAAGAGAIGGGAACGGRAGGSIGAVGPPAIVANSSIALEGGEIVITPPQTEHRARTVVPGILAGSTRKTERHSGQATFTRGLPRERPSASRRSGSRRPAGCRSGDRSSRPSRVASWRSSSFPLQVR